MTGPIHRHRRTVFERSKVRLHTWLQPSPDVRQQEGHERQVTGAHAWRDLEDGMVHVRSHPRSHAHRTMGANGTSVIVEADETYWAAPAIGAAATSKDESRFAGQ
jgi:hypothetical protein